MSEIIGYGQRAMYQLEIPNKGPLWIPVEIRQTRQNYGRTDALISPVGGSGEIWVHGDKLDTEIGERGKKP